MRHCMALAGLACLLAAGCAQSGLFGGRGCGESCHVATSRSAPRPEIVRTACPPDCGLLDSGGEASCGCDDGSCGCGTGVGGILRGTPNGRCRNLVDGIAGGFCGRGAGLCPHSGGYPEQPMFNPGPTTGQVAYPYYTVRGPRDFLACKPQSIGPY